MEPMATYGDLNRAPPLRATKKFLVSDANHARSPRAMDSTRSSSPDADPASVQRRFAVRRRRSRTSFKRPLGSASAPPSAPPSALGDSSSSVPRFRMYATRYAAASSSFKSSSGGAASDTSTPDVGSSAPPFRLCTASTCRTLSMVTARDCTRALCIPDASALASARRSASGIVGTSTGGSVAPLPALLSQASGSDSYAARSAIARSAASAARTFADS